jgi:hypothetical protein
MRCDASPGMWIRSRLIPLVAVALVALSSISGLARAALAGSGDAAPSAHVLAIAVTQLNLHRAQLRNARLWTLIDYERPFTAVRLWVLDAGRGNTVVISSRVSHAWKSGLLRATEFSNQNGSEMSSPGSYATAPRPYEGKFGHSLRVRGLDRGINDHAWERGIVFHPDLGMTHSAGCFMLPETDARRIIDAIAGGSFVYVYSPQS